MSLASQRVSESASQRGRTRSYRDLIAWQKAMALVGAVYALSERFPAGERFGLTSQMRRSAVSIPSNIAEGHGRLSDRYLPNFLGNARGYLFEFETQLFLAVDLQFASHEEAEDVLAQTSEVARILNGLLKTLEADEA